MHRGLNDKQKERARLTEIRRKSVPGGGNSPPKALRQERIWPVRREGMREAESGRK